METLRAEIHDDVVSVVNSLRGIRETEVVIEIPEGSVLFENSLSLRLIKKEAEKFGKTVNFFTTDPAGLSLIEIVEGNNGDSGIIMSGDFVSKEIELGDVYADLPKGSRGKKKVNLSKLGGLSFPALKMPKGKAILLVPLALIALFALYWFAWVTPTAEATVVVGAQPLVKSVELEVGTALESNAKERALQGKTFTALVTKTKSIDTTGEALVGEKAKGSVIVYNYTDDEVTLDEGHDFTGKDNDKSYNLLDDVTIPAATIVPGSPTTPEEVEAEVEAEEIGDDSNIDEDETLLVDEYSISRVVAKTAEDIDNGKSEIVSTVAQADIDTLSTELLEEAQADAAKALSAAVEEGWVLINGSDSSAIVTKEYSHELDEQVDQLELKQTVSFQGLAYNEEALDDMLEVLLEEFVPDGFELSDEDREVSVEILGNTDSTILSTTISDLQVTLKSYMLPQIDEDKIKESLVGTRISEAERVLGGIRNAKSYSIDIDGISIPFLSRMPSKVENITLIIEKD